MHTNTTKKRAGKAAPGQTSGGQNTSAGTPGKRTTVARRKCHRCGETKSLNAFRSKRAAAPGAKAVCRCCERRGANASRLLAIKRALAGKALCASCERVKRLTDFPNHQGQRRRVLAVCYECRRLKATAVARSAIWADERYAKRQQRISLGLAISGGTCPLGSRRSREEIAAFCNCREAEIRSIEEQALRKVVGPIRALLEEAEMQPWEVRL